MKAPIWLPRVLDGLLLQLDRHGFRHISEAVGSGAPWR